MAKRPPGFTSTCDPDLCGYRTKLRPQKEAKHLRTHSSHASNDFLYLLQVIDVVSGKNPNDLFD